MKWAIQAASKSGLIEMLVSVGSLPVMSLPPVSTPLPQSGSQGSVDCCAPYFETLKPQSYGWLSRRRLATHPFIGMVISVRVAVERSCATKASAAPTDCAMFSKYQSLPVLLVSICQL